MPDRFTPAHRDEFAAPPRIRPADARAAIQRTRPGLSPEAPEFRAAVLLLMLEHTGLNVDRLIRRTGFPREFVARCLRRLTDNACWVEGAVVSDWCDEPASCRHFWLDVDVLLGRALRRTSSLGALEWAPVGGWVKDYEYRRGQGEGEGVHNAYREVEHHDPEPQASEAAEHDAPDHDEPDDEPDQDAPDAPAKTADAAPNPPPAHAPEPNVLWLGESEPAPEAPRPEAPRRPAERSDRAERPDKNLVDGWREASWLG